jgi:RNAse (barnase) inhibitor barstar
LIVLQRKQEQHCIIFLIYLQIMDLKITTNPINIPIDNIILINGSITSSISSFYDYLVDNLIVPTYFGKNLDALYDNLTDFEYQNPNKIGIFISNYDNFLVSETSELKLNLLKTLNDVAKYWLENNFNSYIYVENSEQLLNESKILS